MKYQKGHKPSDITKEKIRVRLLGNKNGCGKRSKEFCQRMSEVAKARTVSSETRKKISNTLNGRPLPLEVRKKIGRKREKNPAWKGGVSYINKTLRQIAMQTVEYRTWRSSVFERDNWTCVICNKKGGELNADHIKSWAEYPTFRYDINNGRTLCVLCHRKTDSYGNRNKIYGLSHV